MRISSLLPTVILLWSQLQSVCSSPLQLDRGLQEKDLGENDVKEDTLEGNDRRPTYLEVRELDENDQKEDDSNGDGPKSHPDGNEIKRDGTVEDELRKHHESQNGTEVFGLEKRCANPCGYQGWLCCKSDESCHYLDDGEPECVKGTTTTTGTSQITPAPSATCRADIGEISCANRCCEAAFDCVNGECVQGSSSANPTEPGRPTSSGPSATATQPFVSPVGSDGGATRASSSNNNGISGGAIAGIVIGTIAGVIVLAFFLFCMRGRGQNSADSGFVEERYSRHHYGPPTGAAAAAFAGRRRPGGRTWYGSGPYERRTSSSGMGPLASIGIIIGAIALCLGLRRRHDEHHNEKSDYTSTTASSSYVYPSDRYTYTESSMCASVICFSVFP